VYLLCGTKHARLYQQLQKFNGHTHGSEYVWSRDDVESVTFIFFFVVIDYTGKAIDDMVLIFHYFLHTHSNLQKREIMMGAKNCQKTGFNIVWL
jgi:hypothetical protein